LVSAQGFPARRTEDAIRILAAHAAAHSKERDRTAPYRDPEHSALGQYEPHREADANDDDIRRLAKMPKAKRAAALTALFE
jgi:hypothetical protein